VRPEEKAHWQDRGYRRGNVRYRVKKRFPEQAGVVTRQV
jgi:hypothetical protein